MFYIPIKAECEMKFKEFKKYHNSSESIDFENSKLRQKCKTKKRLDGKISVDSWYMSMLKVPIKMDDITWIKMYHSSSKCPMSAEYELRMTMMTLGSNISLLKFWRTINSFTDMDRDLQKSGTAIIKWNYIKCIKIIHHNFIKNFYTFVCTYLRIKTYTFAIYVGEGFLLGIMSFDGYLMLFVWGWNGLIGIW